MRYGLGPFLFTARGMSRMRMGLLFWILMLIWLIFGFWATSALTSGGDYRPVGGNLLLFLVIALLGWKVFGSPLRE
jgi:hypothetical protein